MTSRRIFLAGIASLVATPLVARAQPAPQSPRGWRIGFLRFTSTPANAFIVEAFRRGLRELGYVEGQNVTIEYRTADGKPERLLAAVSELLELNVDVIVTAGTQATLTAKTATRTVPIVMGATSDAVATGLVASLARPAGNVTGLTLITPELSGKRLGLLKEALPSILKVGIVWNPDNPPRAFEYKETAAGARALGLTLESIVVRRSADVDTGFAAVTRGYALIVFMDPITLESRARILELAVKQKLPTICGGREFAEAGCLISYGPDLASLYHRAAFFVDRILKGTKPADLPVEQPTKFELVINLKTAQVLGLKIPSSLLLRADQIIQ